MCIGGMFGVFHVLCDKWPGNFASGDRVIHQGRVAIVQGQVYGSIKADGQCHYYCNQGPPTGKQGGLVPIRYDDHKNDANEMIDNGLGKGFTYESGKLYWVHYNVLKHCAKQKNKTLRGGLAINLGKQARDIMARYPIESKLRKEEKKKMIVDALFYDVKNRLDKAVAKFVRHGRDNVMTSAQKGSSCDLINVDDQINPYVCDLEGSGYYEYDQIDAERMEAEERFLHYLRDPSSFPELRKFCRSNGLKFKIVSKPNMTGCGPDVHIIHYIVISWSLSIKQ